MSTLEKSIQLLNRLPKRDIETIDKVLRNLIDSIPDSGKTLEEYKTERL